MLPDALAARIASVSDIICAIGVLTWDARTMMPPGGADARGSQIATLTRLARDTLCAPETCDALDAAEAATDGHPADATTRAALAAVRKAIDHHRRVPAEIVARRANLRPAAQTAWAQARARSDFSIFAPLLHATVEAARDYAAAAGTGGHAYDPLIELFEPGETLASLRSMFAGLRAGLAPILDAIMGRPPPPAKPVRGHFPEAAQRALAAHFAARFGYDFSRGRLDPTHHPFEIALTRDDVRITTRYREDDPTQALYGTFHESGHALYEQNIDPAFTRTALATDLVALYPMGGAGSGVHESQSRLYENHVARTRRFWQLHVGALREAFPGQLADVGPDDVYRSVTTVAPGHIRTEADEVTYDFHIFLRVELEAALITGDLRVDDIPAAWNEAMKGLGVRVENDGQGCLQDVHWAAGVIGSFCSYTIGNVMAAQLIQAMQVQQPEIDAALEHGDYAPLGGWLRKNVWRLGRLYSKDELLRRATGHGIDSGPYLDYLRLKYLSG